MRGQKKIKIQGAFARALGRFAGVRIMSNFARYIYTRINIVSCISPLRSFVLFVRDLH